MKNKPISQSTFWRMFDFLKPKRFTYFSTMLVLAGISTAERMFTGYIVKLFVDSIALKDMAMLRNSVLYWGIFAVGMLAVTPFFSYVWRGSIVRGVANMRRSLFAHYQRLPLGYYEMRHSGEAMSTLSNDVAAAEQVYQDRLMTLLQSVFQGAGASIFMLFLKWDLALLMMISGMAPLVINALFAKPLRKVGEDVQGKLAHLSETLGDLVAGFQIIRTFSLNEWIIARFARSNRDVLNSGLKRTRIEAALESANNFGGIFTFAPYLVGAYMVLTEQITLGTLLGLIQLGGSVQYLVYSLGGTISGLQGSLAAGDRILSVLDAEPEPERYPIIGQAAPGRKARSHAGAILQLKDIMFSYGESKPTLDGLSFHVKEGQVAAIVGPSGSGKSTVFRLLMGFYPITKGSAFAYGKPIQSYSLAELRDLFAFVPQDAFLYSGTILENIRFGKMDATREDIIAAAVASNAQHFIMDQPDGYETLVGERGARLSGGQRQRIAIARALLKNAPILLLDEATSALDSESEAQVQQALTELMRCRTTIVIAHRLSTIEKADVIYVMDKGRVVERGRHADLVDQGGLYSHLYQIQFQNTRGEEGMFMDAALANEG